MGNTPSESFKGQFLLAMPLLLDQNFYQTVTCICEYTPAGSVGIVVNRVHPSLLLKDIFDELNIKFIQNVNSIPVHIGEIFILHGPPFEWEGCLMIPPTLALSNTRDILESVAMGRGPESYIIALGCAGWGPGQLESEIMENAWLTSPVFEDVIFEMPVEKRWEASLKKIGVDPALILNTSGHA